MLQKIFNSAITWLLILFLLIIVSTKIYLILVAPQNIHYHYSGVKYNITDLSLVEKTEIYIDGQIKSNLLGKPTEFLGKIKIGDKEFDYFDYPLKFGKDSLAPLDYYGIIFIGKGFQQLTVDIHKKMGIGRYSSSGWMISAPCNNTTEAIKINEELIPKIIRKAE